ncbi:NUDIX hydrolase [Kitasatospora sp. NPDC059408]|uniref:nucleotide triphosphate diphosphatase NUDT15 n=1 Tax=Kitasatospora sp. NPDC059408 TaxID=3346823 RepID=UPI003696B489
MTSTSPGPAAPAPAAPARTVAPMLGAGVIVPTGDGRVLVGRRTTAGEPPTWSLPGGKVEEPGESFEQAAARELAEETGIVLPADAMRVLAVLLDHELGRPRLTAAVLAPPSLAEALVTEPHACAGWERFPVDALPEPMFYPSALVLGAWLPGMDGVRRPGTHGYRIG